MNRRTLLTATGATAVTALSGCAGRLSNEGDDTATTPTQTQGAIAEAVIDDTKLRVTLQSDADVEKVNVIGPDGSSSLGSKSIPTGSTTTSFNLFEQSVPRGQHRVVAVSSEDVVGEASVSLQPNVEIDRVATWVQIDDVEWPTGQKYRQAYLELSNSGNAPQQVTFITMPGAPDSWEKPSYGSDSGLQTLEEDHVDTVVIHPGETRKMFTMYTPFSLGDFTCGDDTNMSIVLSTTIGADVESSYRVETEDPDDSQKPCKIVVTPADDV